MAQSSRNLSYQLETAGAVMDISVPTIAATALVQEVEDLLIATAADFATINYIYVQEPDGHLVGVISIRELFRTEKTARVDTVMKTDLVSVSPSVDQEEVARLAVKYSIKAVPVVSEAGHLLGVVAMDTILRIIDSEITEDFLRIAGATTDTDAAVDLIGATARTHFWKRLPWLLIGLFGGTIAAMIVSQFEFVLAEYVAIAAFIPLIVYLADAVGAQIQLIFIRSLALRPSLTLLPYFWREVKINIALGAVLSVAITMISYAWLADWIVSFVLAISVFVTVCAAMCVGVALPWVFHKIHRDPAIASGPFATVMIDIISLLIYFVIATSLLTAL